MHSALFVAIKPENETQAWFNFIESAKKNEKLRQHAERLSVNVWLVNFRACPAALGTLIYGAEGRAIDYRHLELADPPQWLPAGSGPMPT